MIATLKRPVDPDDETLGLTDKPACGSWNGPTGDILIPDEPVEVS